MERQARSPLSVGNVSVSEPVRIAIVDDDLDIREALKGLLEFLGYGVLSFESAEAFLAFPRRGEVDCMIIDVRMPGLSGLELQQALNQAGCCPPHIFMTSYADELTRKRALSGGASCVLGKPVDDQVLAACLEKALDHR